MVCKTKNIKIAIVAYNLEPGGLSTVIKSLFHILDAHKSVDVELLFLDNSCIIPFTNKYINFKNSKKKFFFAQSKIKKYIRFKNYLKHQQFDYIIDQRYRINPFTEILITKYIYPKTNIIFNVHSSKIETYLPQNKWLTKFLYANAFKVICCSKGVEDLVNKKHKLNNTLKIYNPVLPRPVINSEKNSFNFEYILSIGRVEPIKQIDKLIEVYSMSNLPKRNIKLVVVGDGSHLNFCKTLVNNMNLTNKVVFTGYNSNPAHYFKNALFSILCSKYEGFPMVLIESLSFGTPVVSFDLLAGPNEIIIPNVNGILVQNQDFNTLNNAINKMVIDKTFYNECKDEAKRSVLKFSSEVVKQDWLDLLKLD